MILDHFKNNLKNVGFTMIELLIVIGIIAVLATAVLAAINPVDQINKAKDTGLIASSAELVKAVERYYVTSDKYPWNNLTGYTSSPDVLYSNSNPSNWDAWVSYIENAGEIKRGYLAKLRGLSATGVNGFIYKAANNPSVNICFRPKSKQFREDAVEQCVTAASTLPNVSGFDACPQGSYAAGQAWVNESLCVQ